MKYPAYRYIDTAFGGVNKRNNIVELNKLNMKEKTDCYRTYFRFDDKYIQHFEKNKSVKGYDGDGYSDYLPIDIDDEDISESYKRTATVIALLDVEYDFEVRHLFFSGAKGFHILIPSQSFGVFKPAPTLPIVFKNIVSDLVPKDIEIDYNIYDINRLFRLNNTINSKTGLYKIGLERTQFNQGIDYILDLAKSAQEISFPAINDCIKNEQFIELYEKHRDDIKKYSMSIDEKILDKFKNGVEQGNRNDACIRIAGLLRSKNIDIDLAYTILSGWNLGNDPPMDDKELKEIIESGYRYEDDIDDNDIVPIWSVMDEYRDYVRSDKQVNIGIPIVDKKIRGLRPGQVMTILGYTGNFKSGLLQWILRHYNKYSSEPVLLFELEMSNLDLFERAAQMTLEVSGSEIEAMFKKEVEEDAIEMIKKDNQYFYVVEKPSLNFSEMEKFVEIAEKKLKRPLGLVGIDFLQLMRGLGDSNVQKIDSVAKGLKDFAKKTKLPVIALSQVTDIADEYEKIDLKHARDSKTIGQMSDYTLGIRLKKNTDDVQVISILKNRKGGKGETEITVNRTSMRFEV